MSTSLHVLILEDRLSDAELLVFELQRAGFDPAWQRVETGADFIAHLDPALDLILADYSLPQFDGLRALQLLQERGLDIPFILVSGTVGEEVAVEAMKRGATDYLLKDRLARLGPAVAHALEGKRLRDEKQRTDEELRKSEDRYRDLVENSRDLICTHNLVGRILSVNPWAANALGYSVDELSQMSIRDILASEVRGGFDAYLAEIQQRGGATGTMLVQTRAGERRIWEYNNTLRTEGVAAPIVRGMGRDVTDQKRAEAALRESEERYRTLAEAAQDSIFILGQDERFEYVNSFTAQQFDARPDELVGKSLAALFPPEAYEERKHYLQEVFKTGRPVYTEVRTRSPGRDRWSGTWLAPIRNAAGAVQSVMGIARDITERKRAEETLRASERRLASIYDTVGDVIFHLAVEPDDQYRFSSVNPAFGKVTGLPTDAVVGRAVNEIIPEPSLSMVLGKYRQAIAEKTIVRWEETSDYPTGRLTGEVSVAPVYDDAGNCTHLVGSVHDITERKRAEEQIQNQLERLTALRTIDKAISSSMDLHVTFNVLLEQVTTQLNADAADVLLLNPHMQTLEFAAERGFHTDALRHTRLRLGDGLAGQAALERRTIKVANLQIDSDTLKRSPHLAEEKFVAYFGVPLAAKGEIKGVIEIFHRAPLDPNQDWLDFMETLAGQAAIAIDSADLFNGLQRANAELSLAYDATIEGWSRALDLRDKETEGHTQRVTEMTMRLARVMGLGGDELVHVRRGGLLHDIGKMGVPDGILLKPGALTDEEWKMMRQHPQFAYDMLSPIAYLKSALDIPYCHHEKWDGTGYPRGLKGEQIPLAARIFAIVDVWDALTSARPYRAAWSKEKTLEYIREQSDKYFDPNVVEIFLRMIGEA